MSAKMRDPRSIITPDAFSVSPALLGTPLARPSRRLVALVLDVILVGLITALTSGLWFVLAIVVAAFFMTRARKQTTGDRSSVVFRLFMGCAGVTVLSITVLIYLGLRWAGSQEELGENLATLVEDLDAGVEPEEALERLRDNLGSDRREEIADDDLTAVASLTPGEALEEYRAWLSADPGDAPGGRARGRALEHRIQDLVANDTIEGLQSRIASVEDDLRDTQSDLQEARENRGVMGWLVDKLDNIGFGLGWWTMYFAILMPQMKGQTPGKRALGIRVLRLDGGPITWWHAFERAGGYAAGFATGLLGFAQICWDPNRQAIHDKIAGTVVVRDGAPKVEGLWDGQGQT